MSLPVSPAASARAPRISVIVPAFNAGRTIDTALRSVFAQTYRDFEIIVVDDGSSDDTAERVVAWGDRVTLRRQANAGPAAARNHAMRHARGELIAFLDADDVWLPSKLERQVAYFDSFPETGLLHTDAVTTKATLSVILETPERTNHPLVAPKNSYCAIFHCEYFVKTLTAMVPRAVIDDVGMFDERREYHIEDWDLWLRIAAKYPVGYLPDTLAIHRPDGGMSSNVEKTFRGQKLVIQKALPLCATACARHRDDPAACLSTREHLLHSQLGYERFWRGQAPAAREAYRQAVAIDPGDARARGYVAASYVAPSFVARWRRRRSRPDLLQDTTVRRLRSRISRVIHAADDAVLNWRGGPRRILFEAASPLSMAVFQPVYERMRHDDRVEFWFTAAPDESWDVDRIFPAAGIHDRIVTRDQVRWKKFHAYINTDFWTTTWLPRRVQRLHLFHGVAGKYDLDSPTKIAPVVATFERLMFANADRLRRYADAGLVDPESPRAALVGYPKVDCLVDGSLNRSAIMASLGLDGRKPTVLYAPTWSPYSSLNTMGDAIITALAQLGVNVIVKLHDRSLESTARGSGGVDWRSRIAQLGRKWAVHLAEGSNASPYLFIADALVTDHSSVGFEYTLLDRPIVVMHSPALLRHGRINPEKAALLQGAAHVIDSADRVAATVSDALANPENGRHERRRVANELFYRPGTATARAVDCIYKVLGMSALAPAPAQVPGTPGIAPVHMRPLEMGARRS
jgi:glycosyltransferase involved in cell wall biosynthesis